jgi:hypothetical protein
MAYGLSRVLAAIHPVDRIATPMPTSQRTRLRARSRPFCATSARPTVATARRRAANKRARASRKANRP